jgi:Protein of unknown function (DUF3047)
MNETLPAHLAPDAGCASRASRVRSASVLVVALTLAGCAQMPRPDAGAPQVSSSRVEAGVFAPPNDPSDPAWRAVNLRFKTPTEYTLREIDGKRCIRAVANAAWSFWVADVPAAMAKATKLSWRWNVPALISDADNLVPGKDDAPARVVVAFKGDRTKLDAAERSTMSLAKALGGVELPFAAIQYIWEGKAPPETIVPNGNTSRIKKLVVKSGPTGLASWLSFTRDVRADYRLAFPGEEPGEIESVGLMTDTDSLGGKAEACYSDVELR